MHPQYRPLPLLKHPRTDLAYMDEQALAFMGFRLVDGVIPDSENEVLVSETYLKNRALSVGDTFRFAYVDSLTNEEREEEFTVCGTIQNKEQERGEQFYVVTSNSFRMKYAQHIFNTYNLLFFTFQAIRQFKYFILITKNSSIHELRFFI